MNMKTRPARFAHAFRWAPALTLFLGIALVISACQDDGAQTPTTPTPAAPTLPPGPAPPAVPRGLHIAATGADFVAWTWTAVDGVSGYDVQFSTDEAFTHEDEIIVRSARETSYRREGLVGGTTVYVRVRSATGSDDNRRTSSWSEPVSGHPGADRNLAGIVANAEYIRADVPGNWRSTKISSARIVLGERLTLTLRETATQRLVYNRAVWNSSDPSVATVSHGWSAMWGVDSAGIVETVGLGKATITANIGGHSASVVVEVVPEADAVTELRQSTLDRDDDFGGPQIHFVYAILADGTDNRTDLGDYFSLVADQMQEWLYVQAGLKWRLDTYNGDVDVSFLSIAHEEIPSLGDFLEALRHREGGQLPSSKKYAVFFDYDGSHGRLPYTGRASDRIEVTLMNPHYQQVAGIATHELIHTLGAVPSCAPNSTGSHVSDFGLDIMSDGTLVGGVLDWNNDDYFGHGRTDCLDTADAPYWERVQDRLPVARQRTAPMWSSIPLRCGGVIRLEQNESK